MSLPQSLSRSLILDAPGNLFFNPQVNVSAPSSLIFFFLFLFPRDAWIGGAESDILSGLSGGER